MNLKSISRQPKTHKEIPKEDHYRNEERIENSNIQDIPNEKIFSCEHCPKDKPNNFKSIRGPCSHIVQSHVELEKRNNDNEIEHLLENLSTVKSNVRVLERIAEVLGHYPQRNTMK